MCGPQMFHGPMRRGGSVWAGVEVGEPRLRPSIAQSVGEAGVGGCGQRQWSRNKTDRN